MTVATRGGFVDRIRQDMRQALRSLMRSPFFAATIVLTLGLGIGANTAIFSFVDAMLLRSLPYPRPDDIVTVWEDFSSTGGPEREWFTPPDYEDLATQNRTLEAVTPVMGWNPNLTGVNEPVTLSGLMVSSGYFAVAGISPAMGRGFDASDEREGSKVVVLADGLWQRAFGGNRDILGSTIQLNGEAFTVIGVMPAGFEAPFQPAEIFRPYDRTLLGNCGRGCYVMQMMARVRPGVTAEQAAADIAAIGRGILESAPAEKKGLVLRSIPLHEQIAGPYRPALAALFGAVGLLLLIACVNIASLLVARAATREREMAVRRAIGASRPALLRQLLTESLMLGAVGAAAGLMLAYWGVEALVRLTPPDAPRLAAVTVNGRALAFGTTLSLITGLLFGLVPAFHLSGIDVAGSLRESGGLRSTASRRRLRSVLVGVEVAIAMMLLVGAGLMGRSFMRLQAVDPGFEPENAAAVQLALPRARYEATAQSNEFYAQLTGRLEDRAGVVAAGAVSILPMSGNNTDTNFTIEGRPVAESRQTTPVADYRSVTPGYLAASGMRLLRGRWITEADREGAPDVVVVNETLAKRYWPNEDAIGKRINYRSPDNAPSTIVGIVGDIHHTGLDQPVRPEMYLSNPQSPSRRMWVVVRTEGEAVSVLPEIRAAVRRLDSEQPIATQTTLSDIVSQSVAMPRLFVTFFGFFASVALLLAAVGIYGVTANAVMQRTQEIGIRIALGASARTVVASILGHAMLVAGAGLAVGICGALLLSGALRRLLFDLSPTDPLTFATIAVILAAVVLLASWTPARRAATVDPMKALRVE